MSCEIIALPILLAQVIGSVIAAEAARNLSKMETNDCEDIHLITAQHFMEKDFETVFMDAKVLKKTLEEHGAVDISITGDKLCCVVDNYNLVFTRPSQDVPFQLRITCPDTESAENKLKDLNSEYAMNVQEQTYNSIIEKLQDNNMHLEDEEVLEDNTIVLTVNID